MDLPVFRRKKQDDERFELHHEVDLSDHPVHEGFVSTEQNVRGTKKKDMRKARIKKA